jgi:site-specific DNA-methyltransferase (adenine-specific)
VKPYYEDDAVTIYHGLANEVPKWLTADVLLTDPPYGINYCTGQPREEGNARSIQGDLDTDARDSALAAWGDRPALVFGSWKAPAPSGERTRLIWDQDGALGMGDLSLPWKPSWSVIHVSGGPWAGRRDCGSVLCCPPEQSMGRCHPHQKPVRLLNMLLSKCIPGVVADPFMGSGSTLRAAKNLGRKAIGVEIEERYCEIAAKRMGQEVLDFGGVA